MGKPASVEEYLDTFSEPARSRLQELRELARDAVPEATEELKWGNPAYSLRTILFIISGHTRHANVVFTPSTKEAFATELANFTTGKGSVQLPYDQPVPTDLLRTMMVYRVRELTEHGVLWR